MAEEGLRMTVARAGRGCELRLQWVRFMRIDGAEVRVGAY